MGLPDSYTVKYGSLAAYFDAIQGAEPPERFSVKFLQNLEFKSTNDRSFISILKELGFLDANGVPTKRYFEFLDKSISAKVLGEAVKEMYSDLFAIKTDACKMTTDEVKNKLRTLYAGKKKENIIKLIAKTFTGLCELADFEPRKTTSERKDIKPEVTNRKEPKDVVEDNPEIKPHPQPQSHKLNITGLQYHINIVLPDTKDQAVYDAIFKSLRDHLG